MFKEIEDAIIDTVKKSSLGKVLKTVDAYAKVDKSTIQQFAIRFPGVLVTISDAKFVPETMNGYKVETGLYIFSGARHLGEQRKKRIQEDVGAYAIALSVADLLTNSDLGLGISRIRPESLKGIFVAELDRLGISLYGQAFKTSWSYRPPADDSGIYIDTLGIKYFLKEGDDEADAEDQVTLNEGG